VERPGIVHRIDKDTSGLLVAAKNDAAHRTLAAALEVHAVRREYRALVNGGFATDVGTVDLPIGRHPTDRKRMAVLRDGQGKSRHAVTHYRVLERFGGISYLSLELETGRTHQIRVHMSHMGHPLLGDTVYGGGHTPFERRHAAHISGQCLHAATLTLCHPRTGEEMVFSSPLPADFEHLLAVLREECR
jgi:23S rRNA pseudouridine1911/1915/1917 synthase